ncbi:4-hydroxy-tetrahydrodipicolinate reductase [Iodidimonas sp. SYSU 1G8]|uniref:4-hydroxy-tetrahydrodipicolinate reductase n=1 Tax=Iodidimonas sp. SYSU 1G8 TaxID=3133967 RepID=UPI0031FF071C
MSELAIGILGGAGRMGRALIRAATEAKGAHVAGAVDAPGNPERGKDLGLLAGIDALGIGLENDVAALFAKSDVVIDFTVPRASVEHARLAAETGTAYVVGTTGLESGQQTIIADAGQRTVVVQAANFSLGVNLAIALTERVAAALDDSFDIEIVEMHHRHKVDAPSGTALALGRAAAAGRGVNLDDVADRGRDGMTGARRRGDIGFAVLRGGNVAGDHTVTFAADDERIEITHKAGDRIIFARGAVHAALWTAGRKAGHYSMRDVLEL